MKRNAHQLRVAIVEDDKELRDNIMSPGLRAAGLDAVGFAGAAAFRAALDGEGFDIAVLDVNLPDGNGFALAAQLHATDTTGVIMLSARGADEDRIHALQAGADLYLVKPITMQVLSANIYSLARRLGGHVAQPESEPNSDDASHDTWQLSADDWELVSPSASRMRLTRGERGLLRCLFASHGEVVARAEIIQRVADDPSRFDPHRLDMVVHRLRRKVAQDLGCDLPLHTVRGQGYVLLARGPVSQRGLAANT